MTSSATHPDYSLEHGIDHSGYGGVAPILYVGGPVTPQDFTERDLSGIRGVSISQNWLPGGTRWSDLNLSFLFEALPNLECLRILFEEAASFDVVGAQLALQQLVIDCPKAKPEFHGLRAAVSRLVVRSPRNSAIEIALDSRVEEFPQRIGRAP
jgi:hypothetical protein